MEFDDRFYGHAGADRASAGAGDDRMVGGAGDDRLYGDGDNDRLIGDSGKDVLSSGPGRDTVSGGADSDQFRFPVGDGLDTITDWVDGPDRLVIVKGSHGGRAYDSFDDLPIKNDGDSATVRFGRTTIKIDGADASELTSADVLFV